MKRPDPPRGVPYTPAQARASAKSLTASAQEMVTGPGATRLAAVNYMALAQTLLDYADLREAEIAAVSRTEGVEL